MELRQLEHFLAVAEEGHFTRAALRCRMSQSALSASIRSLERDLDSRLFVRTTRKVELTGAGRVLLEEARPASVSSTLRVVRTKRRESRSLSSAWIEADSADWLIRQRLAARVKWPSSATATNCSS